MSSLRKSLASTFIATALLGGSLATPAIAGNDDHDDYHGKHDKGHFKKWCEEDHKFYYSWWKYDKYCDDDDHDWDHHDKKWHHHKSYDYGKKRHHHKSYDYGKKRHDDGKWGHDDKHH